MLPSVGVRLGVYDAPSGPCLLQGGAGGGEGGYEVLLGLYESGTRVADEMATNLTRSQ